MKETTLCYIEQDNKYLMLHRVKKENDINRDKWIGVGGKLVGDETPEECLLRETKEETGLTLTSYRFRGRVYFRADGCEEELMHLYTADAFSGELCECDEGELLWEDKDDVYDLTLWEGDKIFLKLIESNDTPFFSLKLVYENDVYAVYVVD